MRKTIIKSGDKFGKLTAIRFIEMRKNSTQYWLFRCECGNEKIIRVSSVRNKSVKSCGCLIKNCGVRHGMYKTKTYSSWANMKSRCFGKNNQRYKNYGERGIKVCEEWLVFENFLNDMGERPKGKSIDRIDNNRNYCKENCCWSDIFTQMNNTSRNHFITYKNKTQTIAQWARELNINYYKLLHRVHSGWNIERALTFNIK